MILHFASQTACPPGQRPIRIPTGGSRADRVLAAAEAFSGIDFEDVHGISIQERALLGQAMDVWVAAGGGAGHRAWEEVEVAPGQTGTVREALLRVDLPGVSTPHFGTLAAFGAAVEVLGSGDDEGVSLLGMLRGARDAVIRESTSPVSPSAVRLDGEVALEDAQLVVVSSRGLPQMIARLVGADAGVAGDIRYWATSAHVGAIGRLLDRASRASGVLTGGLQVAAVERFLLDRDALDGGGLPVLVRPGPSVTLRARAQGA